MSDHRTMFYVLRYLGRITKEEFTASYGKHQVTFTPPERVEIDPRFFQSSLCQRCGACCLSGISRIATDSDYLPIMEKLKEVGSDLIFDRQKLHIQQENKEWDATWYVSKKDKRSEGCDLLFFDGELTGCKCHGYKVVNCLLPLLYISRGCNSVRGVLTKRMHGKLWVPGCKASFQPFDFNEFLWDLKVLKRLQLTAWDLGLTTWLDDIIIWCEEHRESLASGNVPEKSIIIHKNSNPRKLF